MNIKSSSSTQNIFIKVAEGGEIEIEPYAELILNKVAVSACTGYKWKGINALDKSELTLKNTSEVKDAEYAVKLGRYTTPLFSNSTFTNNHIGLYVPSTGFAGFYNPVYANISQTTFQKDNNAMLANYIGQLSYSFSNPFAAIEVHEAIIDVNASSATPNHIGTGTPGSNELLNGIRSFNSVLGVENTVVTNIMTGGVGIYSEAPYISVPSYSTLTQTGMGMTANSFEYCKRAIVTYRSSFNITDNKTTTNVNTFTTNMLPFIGSVNTVASNPGIVVTNYGIISGSNFIASTLDITNNNITVTGVNSSTATAAIYYNNAGGSLCSTLINQNVCTLGTNALYGIKAFGGAKTHIKCNTVDMTDANNLEGISTFMINNGEIYNNEVTGAGNSVATQSAFRLTSSNYNYVHCNTSDATGIGFLIEGPCIMDQPAAVPAQTFEYNEMKEHEEGLHLNVNAQIGIQTLQGNTWTGTASGTYSPYGAINFNDANQNSSLLDVNDIANANCITTVPTSGSPNNSGWFHFNNGSNAICTTAVCTTYNKTAISNFQTGLDEIIATETLPSAVFEEETDWQAKRDLYARILQSPSLLGDDLYYNFYDEMEGTDLAKLAYIDYVSSQLCTTSDNQFESLHNTDSTIQSLMKQTAVIDSIIEADGLEESQDMVILKAAIFDTIATLATESSDLMVLEHDCKKEEAAELLTINSEIEGHTLYTDNEKQVNAVKLYNVANDIDVFTETQIDTLYNIAAQCPFSGGVAAVHKARVMVTSFDFSIVWDDNTTCAEAGHYKKMQQQQELENAITIVPNPASEIVTVFFNYSFDKNITLVITDYLGRKVASYLLTSGHKQITIDVHNLAPGVYVVQSNEDKTLSIKFIVIK